MYNLKETLENCPFCGAKAKLVQEKGDYKIFCTSIYCDAQYGWCANKEDAVTGWNRRVNDE